MIDPGPLLRLVAELADDLEGEYGPGAQIGAAVIAVEVTIPDEADLGSIIEHRATTMSTAHILGIVELTNDSLRSSYVRGDDADEDDA